MSDQHSEAMNMYLLNCIALYMYHTVRLSICLVCPPCHVMYDVSSYLLEWTNKMLSIVTGADTVQPCSDTERSLACKLHTSVGSRYSKQLTGKCSRSWKFLTVRLPKL